MKKTLILLLFLSMLLFSFLQHKEISSFSERIAAQAEEAERLCRKGEAAALERSLKALRESFDEAEIPLLYLCGNDRLAEIENKLTALFILYEERSETDFLLALRELRAMAEALAEEDRFSLGNIL